ncbi:MAG: type II toxin-antitoxin system HipA family toxin, partial [Burkholderiales bacterium]
ILSAWPIVGTEAQQVPDDKLRMAMALRGKQAHYHVKTIQPRHFLETAKREGYTDMEGSMQRMAMRVPAALEETARKLPDDFPRELFDKVAGGVLNMSRRLHSGD